MSQQKHLKSIVQVLGARLYIAAAGAVLMVFLARKLSPADFGRYQLVISIAALFPILLDWGLGNSLTRFLAEYRATRPEQVRHVMRRGLWLKATALVVGTAIFVFLWPPLAGTFQLRSLDPMFPWVVGVLVVFSLNEYLLKMIEGFQRFSLMPVLSLTKNSTDLLLSVGLVLSGFGLTGALSAKVAATAIAFLAVTLVMVRTLPNWASAPGRPQAGLTGSLLGYGSWMILIDVAGRVFTVADRFILNRFFDEVVVGLYSVPIRLILLSQMLGLSVANVLGPAASASKDDAARSLKAGTRLLAAIYTVAALGVGFLAPWLIPAVFGAPYREAVGVTQELAVVLPFMGLSPMVSLILNYRGKARARALIMGSLAAVAVLLLFTAIPRWGMRGAAGVVIFSQVTYLTLQLKVASSTLGIPTGFFLNLGRRLTIVAAVVGALLALASTWTQDSWIRLPVFAVAAAACLWLFHQLNVLRRSDWERLRPGRPA